MAKTLTPTKVLDIYTHGDGEDLNEKLSGVVATHPSYRLVSVVLLANAAYGRCYQVVLLRRDWA